MQDQALTTIPFRSGIIKEQTPKAAEGFWTDADKIRFRFNKPELMGGWRAATDSAQAALLIGYPRVLDTVRSLSGERAAVIGTHTGVFSSDLSTYFNITPVVTAGPVTDIFSTSAGSPTILVSLSSHGLTPDTQIKIADASVTIGGNILLSGTYLVSVIDINSFAFDTSTTATETSAATGGTVSLTRYYPAGPISDTYLGGWGTGSWSGNFGWGQSLGGTAIQPMRTWSLDFWGTDLVAVPDGGPLFYWSTSANITSPMVIVSTAPSVNGLVRVATEARHVVLYGTHDISGTYDPLLVRWSSSEDYTDFAPTLTNTAGDYRLPSNGSEILSVVRLGDKTVILTDNDMFIQTYIGSNDVFGFIRTAENCGAISVNCAVEYRGILYWMSNTGQFYRYDGRVTPLECTVLRYVFENLPPLTAPKVYAGTIAQFDEIIWLYTSKDSPDGENDRYVIYNTTENHWTTGSLRRCVWEDRSTFSNPLAVGSPTYEPGIYYHEEGYTADLSAMSSHLQAAYFDLQDGNNLAFCNKIVPDFWNLTEDERYPGIVNIYLNSRKYPNSTVVTKGPYPVSANTQKISTRLRGRELSFRVEASTSSDIPWRMGEFRLALESDGLR